MLIFIRLEPNNIAWLIKGPSGIRFNRVGNIPEWQDGNRLASIEPDRISIVTIKGRIRLYFSEIFHFSDKVHLMIGAVIVHIKTTGFALCSGSNQILLNAIQWVSGPQQQSACHHISNLLWARSQVRRDECIKCDQDKQGSGHKQNNIITI